MKFITKRHDGGYAVFAGSRAITPVPGSTHADKKEADRHKVALQGCVSDLALAMAELIAGETLTGSAIAALQESPPQLTTRANVEI